MGAEMKYAIIWVLLFTLFDYVGFVWFDSRKGTKTYRILQGAFQLFTSILLYQWCGWQAVLGANIMWYFLVCDILFYWIDGKKLDDFTWFKFSPFNFYFNVIKKLPTPAVWVRISALVGVMLGLSVM